MDGDMDELIDALKSCVAEHQAEISARRLVCAGGRRTRFDLIVSNPPYVADGDPHLELNGLPFEPQMALTDGAATASIASATSSRCAGAPEARRLAALRARLRSGQRAGTY
jgi:methylase of polypeptide subunit release factors